MKFAKIRKNNTAFAEVENKDLEMHHGIFVDIFVLDDYVKNGFLRRVTELITMFEDVYKRQSPGRPKKLPRRVNSSMAVYWNNRSSGSVIQLRGTTFTSTWIRWPG